MQLGRRVDTSDLSGYDGVVLATGVVPRTPRIRGIDHAKVVSYIDVLTGRAKVRAVGAGDDVTLHVGVSCLLL